MDVDRAASLVRIHPSIHPSILAAGRHHHRRSGRGDASRQDKPPCHPLAPHPPYTRIPPYPASPRPARASFLSQDQLLLLAQLSSPQLLIFHSLPFPTRPAGNTGTHIKQYHLLCRSLSLPTTRLINSSNALLSQAAVHREIERERIN